jgi:hypothetical protein
VPRLARRLDRARLRDTHQVGARSRGAAHWSWLGHWLERPAVPPVTAPYAWQALATAPGADPDPAPAWIAHCEPLHVVVARDHLRAVDLGEEPLRDDETQALLALANEAARETAAAARSALPPLQFALRAGHWFVHAPAALALETFPLDAVLGRSIQDCLPVGAHARAWRALENEIEMMWHASPVNEAREERGARPANALWLYGGGLAPSRVGDACPAPQPTGAAAGLDAAILRGWLQSGAAAAPVTLALHDGLHAAHALQAWERWLQQLPALEERVEDEARRALQAGGQTLGLVLCGTGEARTYALPLRAGAPPWRNLGAWLRPPARRGAAGLACLVEAAHDLAAPPRARAA